MPIALRLQSIRQQSPDQERQPNWLWPGQGFANSLLVSYNAVRLATVVVVELAVFDSLQCFHLRAIDQKEPKPHIGDVKESHHADTEPMRMFT
ncbi:unnamed protein product [Protopolystoma xenopodis]|uniref:Uncharacterized protein n=1 Tax=Protopolystoma xenopodis TaxID=117903 RepID=A0A448XGP5_9PLAT|nr:unnamed protein product [Protopolystoma xenopodis]